jgi:hypothetical protein
VTLRDRENQNLRAANAQLMEALRIAWDFLGRDRYYMDPRDEEKVVAALALIQDESGEPTS